MKSTGILTSVDAKFRLEPRLRNEYVNAVVALPASRQVRERPHMFVSDMLRQSPCVKPQSIVDACYVRNWGDLN